MNPYVAMLQPSRLVEPLLDACPFFAAEADLCRAVLGDGRVHEAQRHRCGCDEHDACPRFLSRLLRAGRPRATGPVLDMRQK